MFDPTQSCGAIEGLAVISQARARNRKGLEVSAPTGQTSMTLPESSEVSDCATWVRIAVCSPRPMPPSSLMPAMCSRKRTQRVQRMQRVISVATSGPMSSSATARLASV